PLKYNLRNLVVRRVNSLMTVFAIALVVAVFLAVMSLANGLNTALVSTGSPSNVLVMRESAQSEVQSIVTKESYQVIQTIPGIARDASGKPIASAEITVLVNLPRRETGKPSNVTVRGVSPAGFELRPQIKLVGGRMFRAGVPEAIVSKRIADRFASTGLGEQMKLGRINWTVVGVFDAGNTAFDSEIWSDVNQVMDAFDRADYSSVLVRTADTITPQQVADRIAGEQRLKLEAKSESKYYEEQTTAAAPIRALGMFVAVILGIGACFGGMNTMYAAVAARTREIGTLRALGFSRGSILTSFVIESLLLALVGGVIGCLLAVPVNGVTTGTTNFRTFSEVAFSFQLSPELIGIALAFAVLMGLLGGLLPARMASRLGITTALRQL
ncbi:MAG TPA: ABC transporter permease, partial [Blastocatellia bacterium]|nr:ABC transporter permease [Blastocatellia bacterium]